MAEPAFGASLTKVSGDGYFRGEPDVQWWMTQIRAGIAYRKKFAREDAWKRWRNYYRGSWKPSIMPINLYFKLLRTLVPRVYFRNPSVSVTSTKPGTEYQILAKILERADNKLIDRMGFKAQMKRMVRDGFLFGTAVGKLGYGAQFTPTPEMLGTDDPVTRKGRVEYNSLIHENTPWFLRVHPGNFIVPAGLEAWESARWCAHWIRRPLGDVQDDPRFKHVAGLKASKFKQTGSTMIEEHSREPLVDLIEVRDKKSQQVFVLAPFATDKVLFHDGDDLQIDGGLPYYPLIFNDDDECFWGVPDAQILEPQQLEINETRTIIMKHRRWGLKKFFATPDAMTPDEEGKLSADDENVGAVVHVEDIAGIKTFEPGDIPAILLRSMEMTEREVEQILGLGTNQFGEYAPGSADRSATEAHIVDMASQIRTDERRDTAADLIVDFARDMHQVLFERWSGEQVIDVIGPYGLQIWVKFTPEMLKSGSYDVKVDPDSNVPETKEYREQKAGVVYDRLKTNPLINPVGLTEYYLHELQGTAFDDMLLKKGIGMSPEQPVTPQQLAQAVQGQGLPPQGGQPLRAIPGGRG